MVKKYFRTRLAYNANETLSPVVRLWILRILHPLGGYKEWVRNHGFRCDELARALGLEAWLDEGEGPFDARAVRLELRQRYSAAEKQRHRAQPHATMRSNIQRLATLANLSPVDEQILAFACAIHQEPLLESAADYLGNLSSARVAACLAVILDFPVDVVRAALAPQAVLSRTGLVLLDRNGPRQLRGCLDLLSGSFADHMHTETADILQLLRGVVQAAPPAQLALDDYLHTQPQLDIALPYLRQASQQGQHGVNFFIHGSPGTGKTELARTLAAALGCELFEVASEDSDGDPINAERRLRALQAVQSFFSQRQALLVFDEVEDVFNDSPHPFGGKSTAQQRKAWINRMLESNPMPTLWLSNSGTLDPAFIRRFDMVFELPVPPQSQRLRIIDQQCQGLLDSPAMQRMSQSEYLAPAVVARAAKVVRSIQACPLDQDQTQKPCPAAALERLVNNTLQAQGHPSLQRQAANQLPQVYDPAFIHADAELAAIAQGIAAHKSARLCLYGPPGTGKTAYGRWLAQQLDMPLLVQRASDLQSMYVGECEKNLARAFRAAEQDGALLLIDEVDSFLQDRRGAQRSWEVSQVNEMLTQMESFSGVFIATTNLMHGLDQAALRRFDLKVKLDFLRTEQAWALLLRHCAQLGLATPGSPEQSRLARLRYVTPGDFAAVLRQGRFRPLADAAALVAQLEAECALKEGAKGVMGFV